MIKVFPFLALLPLTFFYEGRNDVRIPAAVSGIPYPLFEGWAAETSGGRGGTVYRVTNLNTSGAGSFADAVTTGSRYVVFDVGGTIDLNQTWISIQVNNISIFGQTAPSPGIILTDGGLEVRNADNVIVQHIRIRASDAWDKDALNVYASSNVVIDHVSTCWGDDETLSVSGPRFTGTTYAATQAGTSNNVTISNCLIAEGIGTPQRGSIGANDNITYVLWAKNLWVNNAERQPNMKAGIIAALVNNAVYNGNLAIHGGATMTEWQTVFDSWGDPPPIALLDIIGNYIQRGDLNDTHEVANIRDRFQDEPLMAGEVYHQWYLDDNELYAAAGTLDTTTAHFGITSPSLAVGNYTAGSPTTNVPDITIMDISQVKNYIISNVGARYWEANTIDDRQVADFQNRTGTIINAETDKEGLPVVSVTNHVAGWDDDNDGMKDAWETEKGVTTATGTDLHATLTNIEVYAYERGENDV